MLLYHLKGRTPKFFTHNFCNVVAPETRKHLFITKKRIINIKHVILSYLILAFLMPLFAVAE